MDNELAARLAANPHNLGPDAMCQHDYWAARFERQGRQAGPGAVNPHNPGTMAFDRWNSGRKESVV